MSVKGYEIWVINAKGQKLFKVFEYDNGPTYPREGFFRIISQEGKLGFTGREGKIQVYPIFL